MSEIDTPYDRTRGAGAVRHLTKTSYPIMSERTQTLLIRDILPQDIAESEEKFYLFLTGWLGGSSLYTDKHGHPKLRERYLTFSIGIEESEQWLYCMAQALSKMDLDLVLAEQLMASFSQTADFMRNNVDVTTKNPKAS